MLAAWSGIRPLVTDPNSKDTQSICRNHIVSISDSGLITIAGQPLGHWLSVCVLGTGGLEIEEECVNLIKLCVCVFRGQVDHLQVHG